MSKKILIDAAHLEEIRVAVTQGNDVENFGLDIKTRKQLRGNIYLAKVTRVEPSLQAAFVDYGGNRHGFLSFDDIHPNYYHVPQADRDELEPNDLEPSDEPQISDESQPSDLEPSALETSDEEETPQSSPDPVHEPSATHNGGAMESSPNDSSTPQSDAPTDISAPANAAPASQNAEAKNHAIETPTQHVSLDEESNQGNNEESPPSQTSRERDSDDKHRQLYRIQEVVKKNQVFLVQVVREERGNKGVTLTTYVSLAGRYCVLMPNTNRGGGVSRKVTDGEDRKRLKSYISMLNIPEGVGLIIRTAGSKRNKIEIKRDYNYLTRLWNKIYQATITSKAPCLIYEESDLIKQSIRDYYDRTTEEILVEGEKAFEKATDVMRLIMPTSLSKVQLYQGKVPLFERYGVENRFLSLFNPEVSLQGGGYININQTEALVAIDVNSGKSTKTHTVEETALHTNLEAASAIAKQLRMRNLGGLVVIDFIDMEERKNKKAVEKHLRAALKSDRVRIQIGTISRFGLLEMSRQRVGASIIESGMDVCTICSGEGRTLSIANISIQILRDIALTIAKNAPETVRVETRGVIKNYLDSNKRKILENFESTHGVNIIIEENNSVQTYTIKPKVCAPTGQKEKHSASGEKDTQDDELRKKRTRNQRRKQSRRKKTAPPHEENLQKGDDMQASQDVHSQDSTQDATTASKDGASQDEPAINTAPANTSPSDTAHSP